MNNKLLLIAMVLSLGAASWAQGVAINETGAAPHPSAALDVDFNNKGFLPPRMTTAERDAIISPLDGMIIYNSTTGCINILRNGVWHLSCGTIPGAITTLDCDNADHVGSLNDGETAMNVSSSIDYTGGNGGSYSAQSVNSTGVLGLVASVEASSFASGSSTIVYFISGTPGGVGVAEFIINIGGQSCVLERSVDAAGPYPSGYVHCNPSNPTAIVDVYNAATNKTWMDRNLGASQVANSFNDVMAVGSLFQWGRFADGHQCVNRYVGDGVISSGTTDITVLNSDIPGHSNFILTDATTNNDWRNPKNNNLWQGLNGTNNPCPTGYRIPTSAEWSDELSTLSITNGATAYSSILKLTSAGGRRKFNENSIESATTSSYHWSSTTPPNENWNAHMIGGVWIKDDLAQVSTWHSRGSGYSVRCIKD